MGGAALEVYGLCLYFCEQSYRVKRLRLNVIEKVAEWQPTRHLVLHRWIKGKFPKLTIHSFDIDADLTDDCIPKLSQFYDHLADTDILMIYNVLNEVDTRHAEQVWRNINFILKNCDKRLLILLMEPYAPKAMPRVDWLIGTLSECCKAILQAFDEEIHFTSPPIEIQLEGTDKGINDWLFSPLPPPASNPAFRTSIKRTHAAFVKDRDFPISPEQMYRQLQQFRIGRGKRGRFISRRKKRAGGEQLHFSGYDDTFPI